MDKQYLMLSLTSIVLISLMATVSCQNCSTSSFASNNVYASCLTLPVLNSFLHWNYHPINHTVDIAFRMTGVSSSNWIAWAINPTGSGMIGAQCLVAFKNTSGNFQAYTSPVSDYNTQLDPAPLSFGVLRTAVQFSNNNEMVVFGTLQLPAGNKTRFNHVWEVGRVSGNTPLVHTTSGANVRSTGTLDFATGQASGIGGAGASTKKNVHGILNALSWGILMPIGALMARYLRVFKSADPAWFYLHVTCQTSAYIVGAAGWGTGLQLGGDSGGSTLDIHSSIGLTLLILGSLQVIALLLRPKPTHKYRYYWNIYHHLVGYIVIILSIVNVFEGIELLNPNKKWKQAYIAIIAALGVQAAFLEAYTWWYVVTLKWKNEEEISMTTNGYGVNGVHGGANSYGVNGVNGGANGYGVNGVNGGANGYGSYDTRE